MAVRTGSEIRRSQHEGEGSRHNEQEGETPVGREPPDTRCGGASAPERRQLSRHIPRRRAVVVVTSTGGRRPRRCARSDSSRRVRTVSLGRRSPAPAVIAVVVVPRRRGRITTRVARRRNRFPLRIVAPRVQASRRWGRSAPHPVVIIISSRPDSRRGRIVSEVPRRRGRRPSVTIPARRRRVIIVARVARREVARRILPPPVGVVPGRGSVVSGRLDAVNERSITSRMARTTSEQSSKCLSYTTPKFTPSRVHIPAGHVVGALPRREEAGQGLIYDNKTPRAPTSPSDPSGRT